MCILGVASSLPRLLGRGTNDSHDLEDRWRLFQHEVGVYLGYCYSIWMIAGRQSCCYSTDLVWTNVIISLNPLGSGGALT
jgi:hypothetical protein